MPNQVALVLGPVLFAGFEIPDRIGFGGDQRLAVHDMPGGQRVIDTLGAAPADIAWSGIFSGPDATARARTLDTLRVDAAVLALSWDVFFFRVVIRSFEATYRNTGWAPYRITVSVLPETFAGIANAIGALVSDAAADALAAVQFGTTGGVDLAALQTDIGAPDATVLGTASYQTTTTTLAGAQTQVQAGLNTAGTTLDRYANGLASAADVAAMTAAAGNAAALSASNAYLGRLSGNLHNASS